MHENKHYLESTPAIYWQTFFLFSLSPTANDKVYSPSRFISGSGENGAAAAATKLINMFFARGIKQQGWIAEARTSENAKDTEEALKRHEKFLAISRMMSTIVDSTASLRSYHSLLIYNFLLARGISLQHRSLAFFYY
jgi:hypothetical protein